MKYENLINILNYLTIFFKLNIHLSFFFNNLAIQQFNLMTYTETLTGSGWYFTDSCNCGGTLKRNYKNNEKPGYTITVQPARQNFILKQGNAVLKVEPLADLETILAAI